MVRVLIDDTVIADSDETKMVEGNHYFPAGSVKKEFLTKTDLHTVCHWKGNADYFDIEVDGKKLENAAWTYPDPTTDQAKPIKDYFAFYPNKVAIVT